MVMDDPPLTLDHVDFVVDSPVIDAAMEILCVLSPYLSHAIFALY